MVMVLSIRSSTCAFVYSPMFRRAPRGAAGEIRAAVLRVMACFAALIALLFFANPAQSDEIEPESEPAPQAEPEPVARTGAGARTRRGAGGRGGVLGARLDPVPRRRIRRLRLRYRDDHREPQSMRPRDRDSARVGEVSSCFEIGGELMGPMFERSTWPPALVRAGWGGAPHVFG